MQFQFLYYLSFLKKIGLAFIVYSICRLLFYFFNIHTFQGYFPFDSFLFGLRFDYVAISYFFLPFIFFSILPVPFKDNKIYKFGLKFFFHLGNTIGIIFNLIDVAYYPFSLRRSTADLFQFLSTGNDFSIMLPKYIKDYWFLCVILIALLVITEFLYRKFDLKPFPLKYSFKAFTYQLLIFILLGIFTVVGFRGGLQYKPLDIINAATYSTPQHASVTLNTPFCIIKTILNDHITKLNYFDEKELTTIYSPEQKTQGKGMFKSKNVVIIILESFAKEHVGFYNNGKGFTPFLDSLMQHSYVFTNSYASGTRSIEALPSILAGIPPLMNTPYIISNYSSNKIDALPSILKKQGYNTSFYHGGSNGTMGFSGFAATAGIDHYFGKDEYPLTKADEDEDWGIFDEPYLNYFAKQLNAKKEPFFSAIFTLSSHHPYQLPPKYEGKFPLGTLPIHKTIGYTDFALKEFFEGAKKSTWYNNTIFVFTADHSSQSFAPFYSTIMGATAIPIFIYDPTQKFSGIDSNYFQQVDITPTVLDLLGINTSFVSFGESVFSKNTKHIIGYASNNYYYAEGNELLLFDGENSTGLFNLNSDSLLQTNLINSVEHNPIKTLLENKLKSILQHYNNRLIDNRTSKTTLK